MLAELFLGCLAGAGEPLEGVRVVPVQDVAGDEGLVLPVGDVGADGQAAGGRRCLGVGGVRNFWVGAAREADTELQAEVGLRRLSPCAGQTWR